MGKPKVGSLGSLKLVVAGILEKMKLWDRFVSENKAEIECVNKRVDRLGNQHAEQYLEIGEIERRLKALEEWKGSLKLGKNQQIDGSGLGILLAPKTGFGVLSIEPIKLPCTTCKHRIKGGSFLFPNPSDDRCGRAGAPHIWGGPGSKYCVCSNSDQLCKFHSERNK